MAIFRTDRDRRILGDRLAARREVFGEIHAAVGEVHGIFSGSHEKLAGTLEDRRREENEDETAREARQQAAVRVAQLYSWAHGQVGPLLCPSWEVSEPTEEMETVQARLFPMGAPSTVAGSPQMLLDAMRHFIAAAERETAVTYPAGFLDAARQALAELDQAIAQVTVESGETTEAVAAVDAARTRWDTCYTALKEVTSGFLRLKGEHDRFKPLFRDLPKSSAGKADAPAETETEPEVEA